MTLFSLLKLKVEKLELAQRQSYLRKGPDKFIYRNRYRSSNSILILTIGIEIHIYLALL